MTDLWDQPRPFTIDVVVKPEHIDSFGHVSNVEYIQWLTDCAWAHSAAVGLPEATCVALQRGMAVRDMQVQMLASAYEGETLIVGNWLVEADGRLRATRRFQIVNPATGTTLIRAEVQYVCVNLSNGRPTRMPPEFVERYTPDIG